MAVTRRDVARSDGRGLEPASVPAARPIRPHRSHPLHLRLLDIVGAVVGMIVLSPVVLLAAAAMRLTSPGGALFHQVRLGQGGRAFRCYKLRTMYVDAPDRLDELLRQPTYRRQWHSNRKLVEDPRVTSVGRVVRSLDLDEVPQLWNVLKGDMSLVGPRPVPKQEILLYGSAADTVLSVKPGMTGLWQVSGRNRLSYGERVELDLRYVKTRSLLTNLRLVGKTILLILLRRNGAT